MRCVSRHPNRGCRREFHVSDHHAAHGLTLLEVVIAVSIMAMLMAMIASFFQRVIEVREVALRESDRTQIARQVLERIATELRGCIGAEEIGFPVEQRLVGTRREITFLTTELPEKHQYEFLGEFDDQPPGEHDLTLVSYRLWTDPDDTTEEGDPMVGGILRVEKKTLNQVVVDEEEPLQLRTDLWSHELAYLEFRYFDGIEWTTVWDVTQGNSLPQIIQVTVGYEPLTMYEYEDTDIEDYPLDEEPLADRPRDSIDEFPPQYRDRYRVLVRIPAADQFFGSRVQRLGQQLTEQMGVEGLTP